MREVVQRTIARGQGHFEASEVARLRNAPKDRISLGQS